MFWRFLKWHSYFWWWWRVTKQNVPELQGQRAVCCVLPTDKSRQLFNASGWDFWEDAVASGDMDMDDMGMGTLWHSEVCHFLLPHAHKWGLNHEQWWLTWMNHHEIGMGLLDTKIYLGSHRHIAFNFFQSMLASPCTPRPASGEYAVLVGAPARWSTSWNVHGHSPGAAVWHRKRHQAMVETPGLRYFLQQGEGRWLKMVIILVLSRGEWWWNGRCPLGRCFGASLSKYSSKIPASQT